MATVADGNLQDLNKQYDAVKADIDAQVSAAMTLTKASDINHAMVSILDAKHRLIDILNQMVTITTQTSGSDLDEKREKLLKRLHEVQRQYNEISESDDRLKTLERIRAREEEKFDGPFYIFGGIFVLACFSLIGVIILKKA
jgi:ElaB/YqjD/DUF883 family membrane-anchored ribosome-binding protein